jgi:hypothetical protein
MTSVIPESILPKKYKSRSFNDVKLQELYGANPSAS